MKPRQTPPEFASLSPNVMAWINSPERLAIVRATRKDTADRIRACRRLGWPGYRPAVRAVRHPRYD